MHEAHAALASSRHKRTLRSLLVKQGRVNAYEARLPSWARLGLRADFVGWESRPVEVTFTNSAVSHSRGAVRLEKTFI